MHQKSNIIHKPVVLEETLKYLAPQPGETFLDVTAGYGGHATEVLERTRYAPAVLVDRDKNAISYLAKKFKGRKVNLLHKDFLLASQELKQAGEHFDMILADLGVSSPHLNTASRGFSFQTDGPLDMRMDQSQSLSAAEIVNNYSEIQLRKIIREFGQEPRAVAIARAILIGRPINSTKQLAEVVARALYQGKRSNGRKIHPATRTFQALRIAVNDELAQLQDVLPIWIDMLNPDGRIVVISFHSLEDGLVKTAFAQASGGKYDAVLRLLTKHPVVAGQNEIAFNPRARSVKLRAAAKIKT